MLNIDWPLKRYHKVYAGIKEYATKHTDWTLVWDPFPELKLKGNLKNPYYSGLIGRCDFNTYEAAKNCNIPIINTWFFNKIKGLPSVLVDFEKSGALAAENLIKRGFRNIVSFNYRADPSSKAFNAGASEVLKKYNCTLKKVVMPRDIEKNKTSWKRINDDFSQWAKKWEYPLAVMTANCELGPKISTFCSENGLRVPEDVVILTSGNDTAYCEGFSPTISSIDIDYFKIGYEAAQMLDRKIKGKTIKDNVIYLPPVGVVPRESTDSYAIQDKQVKIALRFIADNFEKNICVDDIVSRVAISRRSLEKRFMKTLGRTMFDEMNRLRIETMKRLLLESELNIKDLSLQAGFSSPQQMRRSFINATGISPIEFRKTANME